MIEEQAAFIKHLREQISKKNEEIARLREIFEFYSDNKNYEVNVINQWAPEIKVMMDGGAKTAKLLEELK